MGKRIAVPVLLGACVLLAGMWLRSYFISDVASFGVAGIADVRSYRGTVYYVRITPWGARFGFAGPIPPRGVWSEPVEQVPVVLDGSFTKGFRALGFISMAAGSRHQVHGVPFWALIVIAGLYPLWCLQPGRNATVRRFPRGFCQTCGYDMRGSVFRCPECGDQIVLNTSIGVMFPVPRPRLAPRVPRARQEPRAERFAFSDPHP